MTNISTRLLPLAGFAALGAVAVLSLQVVPSFDMANVESAAQYAGPVAIVALVALGIVVTPIPSGVVALVAGAMYGTMYGGALTVAGAILGSASAFAISRYLGRGLVSASDTFVARALTGERSQNGMMVLVFMTRLIPFISFDAVSYLSGLTRLQFWRFIVATALGTSPVCLGFAAAGAKAMDGPSTGTLLAASAGVTLLLPAILFASAWIRRKGIRVAQAPFTSVSGV